MTGKNACHDRCTNASKCVMLNEWRRAAGLHAHGITTGARVSARHSSPTKQDGYRREMCVVLEIGIKKVARMSVTVE